MGLVNWTERILIAVGILAIYLTVVWIGLTEESRRSLTIMGSSPSGDDYVIINVRVASIDTAQGLLHGRIRLIPTGRFAKDQATPASDLKLLINSVSGKQTVVFPAGERIYPIDFTALLSGNQNRYPFDRYVSDIEFMVTAPARQPAPVPEEIPPEDNLDPLASPLIVGSSDLDKSETVTIKENLSASIPGLKFGGRASPVGEYKLMHSAVAIRRANSVITVSLVVMTVMILLALSIMIVVLQTTASPGLISLVPLSLCIALIFGLPALRNVQPGVPGVGVVGDYMSFIWAEFIVSTSAITLAWTWIIRSVRTRKSTVPM
jgi:Domain of unknown function (DUF4436)